MRLNFLTPPPIPGNLPSTLETQIDTLRQYETKEEVLTAAYDLLSRKYRGYRIKTLTRLFDLFDVDIDRLWAKNGFLHCTNLNYLMEIFLVGSGKFSEDDIRFKWTLIHFYSPHQYLRVRIKQNEWIDVDLWGKAYGVKFGSHAHGLQSGTVTATNV